jgi:hemerythrin-like metal-binding protein
MLLNWKDEYSVSIEAVDYEHKQLIDLINRLHDELAAKDSKLTVSAFLGDLLKGISAHFALEETFRSLSAAASGGRSKTGAAKAQTCTAPVGVSSASS